MPSFRPLSYSQAPSSVSFLQLLSWSSTCHLYLCMIWSSSCGIETGYPFLDYADIVGDADDYSAKLSERFPSKFRVAKKAVSLCPVVSWTNIVAKWETCTRSQEHWIWMSWRFSSLSSQNMLRCLHLEREARLEHHKHSVFGFPTLAHFSWGTYTTCIGDTVEVLCLQTYKRMEKKMAAVSMARLEVWLWTPPDLWYGYPILLPPVPPYTPRLLPLPRLPLLPRPPPKLPRPPDNLTLCISSSGSILSFLPNGILPFLSSCTPPSMKKERESLCK